MPQGNKLKKIERQHFFYGKGVSLPAPFLSFQPSQLSFEMSTLPSIVSSIDEHIAKFIEQSAHHLNELVRYKAEIAARFASPQSPVAHDEPAVSNVENILPPAGPTYILPEDATPLLAAGKPLNFDCVLAKKLKHGEVIYRPAAGGVTYHARVYLFDEPSMRMEFHSQFSPAEPRVAFASLSAFSNACGERQRAAVGGSDAKGKCSTSGPRQCYVMREGKKVMIANLTHPIESPELPQAAPQPLTHATPQTALQLAPQPAPQPAPQAAPVGPYILPDIPRPLLSCHDAPKYDVILARNLAQGELIYRRKRSGEVNVARAYRFQDPTQPGVSHMEFHFQLNESEPRLAFKSLPAFSCYCLELDRKARGVVKTNPAEDGKHCFVKRVSGDIRIKTFYA